MRWLFYRRLTDSHWVPAYGPLSSYPWNAIALGTAGFITILLIWESVLLLRLGRGQYWRSICWPLAGWMLFVALGAVNQFPSRSTGFSIGLYAVTVLYVAWAIYGVWRVLPLLNRRRVMNYHGKDGRECG